MLIEPRDGPRCLECPLYSAGIPVEDLDATEGFSGLVIMGEMPGFQEVKERLPFRGPSGSLLRGCATPIGVNLAQCYITNSIRCGLPRGAKPSDNDGHKALECCQALVIENLKRLKPRVVLCLGTVAWESMSGLKGIDKYRGTCLLPTEAEPWIVTGTLHPAGLLHVEGRRILVDLLVADLRKAWQLALGEIMVWKPEVRDAGHVPDVLTFLSKVLDGRLPMALDVETRDTVDEPGSGIDPYRAAMLTIGVSAFTEGPHKEPPAFSIPWPYEYPDYYQEEGIEAVLAMLREFLCRKDAHAVFHNKPFDVPVLERHLKIQIACIRDDTLLMHHAAYPKLPHKLQQVMSHEFPIEPWKDDYHQSEDHVVKEQDQLIKGWNEADEEEQEEILIQVRDMAQTSFSELLWYNSLDAAATIKLYQQLLITLEEDGVLAVYEQDRALVDYSTHWSEDGIGIDLAIRDKLMVTYQQNVKKYLTNMCKTSQLPSAKALQAETDPLKETIEAKADLWRQTGRVATLVGKLEAGKVLKSKWDRIRQLEGQLLAEPKEDHLKTIEKLERAKRDEADREIALEEQELGRTSEELKARAIGMLSDLRSIRARLLDLEKRPSIESFNPNSDAHIREVLMLRGQSPTKVTQKSTDKDGNRLLSVSKDSLWEIRDDEFVNALFLYRTDAKILSTYLAKLPQKLDKDGRLHPSWKLHSTPSGRFGTQPAVQNWNSDLKALMVPAPGNVIVGADYAALELRIAALLGDEREWIDVFMSGQDLHSMMAHKYFRDTYTKVNAQWEAFQGTEKEKDKAFPLRKELRGRGKNVTFGDIYLAGAETLYQQVREKMPHITTQAEHAQLRREIAEAQAVLRAATPNRIEFARNQYAFALENYYLRAPTWTDQYGNTYTGRIRKWPMGDPSPNECANHPIQSFAAAIMNAATIRLCNWLEERGIYRNGAWIIIQIHDFLALEVQRSLAEEVRDMLERALYTEVVYRSPVTRRENLMQFTAEATIGSSVAEV